MSRGFQRLLTSRPGKLFASLLLALAVAGGAFAYFTSHGTGTASATVGTLNAPTNVQATATPGSGTVPVTWTASTSGGGAVAPQGYYVTRTNTNTSTTSAACGSSSTSLVTGTSCNDTSVPDGTYTYTVMAKYHTWMAPSSPSSSVTVINDNAPPTTALSLVSPAHAFMTGSGPYTLYYKSDTSGSFRIADQVTDNGTGPASANFPGVSAAGWSGHTTSELVTSGSGAAPTITYTSSSSSLFQWNGSASNPSAATVTAKDVAGNATNDTVNFVPDTTAPTSGALTVASTAATSGGATATNNTGSFNINSITDYTDGGSGIASSTLSVQSATYSSSDGISAGTCGSFGAATTITSRATPIAETEPTGCYLYTLTGIDKVGNTASISVTVKVDKTGPSTPNVNVSNATGSTFISGSIVYINPQSSKSGGFTASATSTDGDSGIQKITFPTLTGFSSGGGDKTTSPFTATYAWSGAVGASGAQTVTAVNNVNLNTSKTSAFTVTPDTSAPTGGAFGANGTPATSGGSSSFLTSGTTLAINSRTDYNADTGSGLASSVMTIQSASLSNNSCGTFGSSTTISGTTPQTVASGNCYLLTLTGTDNVGNTATVSTTVKVDTSAPTTPTLAFSGLSSNAFFSNSFNTLYVRPASGGAFTVTASSTDPETGIKTGNAGYSFASLSGNNFSGTQNAGQEAYTFGSSATQPGSAPTVFATNNAGINSPNASYTVKSDTTAPTGGALTVNGAAATSGGSTSTSTDPGFTIGVRTDYTEAQSATASGLATNILTAQSETLIGGTCGAAGSGGPFTSATQVSGMTQPSGILSGYCYLYTLTGTDNVRNGASISTTVQVPLSTDLGNNLGSPCTLNSSHSCTLNGVTTTSSRNELIMVFLNNGPSGTRSISSITGTALNSGASEVTHNNFDTGAHSWLYAWKATGTGTASGNVTVNFDSGATSGTVYIDVIELAAGDAPTGTPGTNGTNSKTAVAILPSISTASNGEIAMIGVSSTRTFNATPPNSAFTTLATAAPSGGLYGSFWTRPAQSSANFALSPAGSAPNWGSIAIEIDPPSDGTLTQGLSTPRDLLFFAVLGGSVLGLTALLTMPIPRRRAWRRKPG